ncbi:MAG: competence/damage-inducible protein A [Candidatus Izemoplasma sp.]|nr:competence/damage-inducible protein A [Candidatus Izemoplasma sp.]
MKTAVITVGKELLTGRSINSNLATIAKALLTIGIEINRSFVIDDNKDEYHDILESIDAELIIFTGGLGPTIDDITKEVVFDYFDIETVIDERILSEIKAYFARMGRTMTDANKKQARTPKEGIVLDNTLGTAPGVYFKKHDQRIVLFPGPPHEMKPMLDKVVSLLKKELHINYYSQGFKLVGVGESTLEEQMQAYYDMHPDVRVNPYASVGEIKYILYSYNKEALEDVVKRFKKQFSQYIYGELDDTLESVVVRELIQQNRQLSLAESCTGGMIASRIVNVSGASKVFSESLVTYSNTAKERYLNVDHEILLNDGAVSEACAKAMVEGLANATQSDIALAVTGIAGPSGGTDEKPVGLVYFGLYKDGKITVKRNIFNGDRQMIRHRASQYALNMIRKAMIE